MSASISYKDIFNTTTNGVLVTDAQGYLTHINRQAEQGFQLPGGFYAGRRLAATQVLRRTPAAQ